MSSYLIIGFKVGMEMWSLIESWILQKGWWEGLKQLFEKFPGLQNGWEKMESC